MLRRGCAVTRVVGLAIVMAAGAQAFVPPPCDEDPSRVIFAGAGNAPCKTFNNDPAACDQSYYMNRDGTPSPVNSCLEPVSAAAETTWPAGPTTAPV